MNAILKGQQLLLLYSWSFSRYSAPIHWLFHCHMTSNNETVSRQMPWAGNIAKTMTSNRKQFTVTREMLTAFARYLKITWLFVFHRFDPFALLYNKSLNDLSLGEQWILYPSNLDASLDFVSGNIEILWKQNSLFPSGKNTRRWTKKYSMIDTRLSKSFCLSFICFFTPRTLGFEA